MRLPAALLHGSMPVPRTTAVYTAVLTASAVAPQEAQALVAAAQGRQQDKEGSMRLW